MAKFQIAKGASHHLTLMDNCWTLPSFYCFPEKSKSTLYFGSNKNNTPDLWGKKENATCAMKNASDIAMPKSGRNTFKL